MGRQFLCEQMRQGRIVMLLEGPKVEGLAQDVKVGCRQLEKKNGFSLSPEKNNT